MFVFVSQNRTYCCMSCVLWLVADNGSWTITEALIRRCLKSVKCKVLYVLSFKIDQLRKYRQARFWPPYFGMCKIFCSSIALRIVYRIIDAFEGRNRQKKTATNKEEKSALSPRQCAVSQVDRNDGKTTWTALLIASVSPIFFRSGPQWLRAVCRAQKNAQEKEIWL